VSDITIVLSGLVGAILGVILGSVLTYFVQIFLHNNKKKTRKKFLATIFLNEINEIVRFTEDLKRDGIDRLKIVKYDVNTNNPSLDVNQYANFIISLNKNPYFSLSQDVPQKKPFEIFNVEIYSFEDPELIRDLNDLSRMIYIAEGYIQRYFKSVNNSDNTPDNRMSIVYFLSMVEHINVKINKILSDGNLNRIASKGCSK